MPRVPRVTGPRFQRSPQQTGLSDPRSTFFRSVTPAAAFGQGGPQAEAERSVNQLTNTAIGIAANEFARANKTAVIEAKNKLHALSSGIQRSMFARLGKDAAGAPVDGISEFKSGFQEVENSLSNRAQREMLRNSTQHIAVGLQDALVRHSFNELRKHERKEQTSSIALDLDSYSKSGGREFINSALGIQNEMFSTDGTGKEAASLGRKELLNSAHMGRINALLKSDKAEEAAGYFSAVKDEMTANSIAEVEKVIEKGQVKEFGRNKALELIAKANGDTSKALEMLNVQAENIDKKRLDSARDFLRDRLSDEALVRSEKTKQSRDSMWDAYTRDGGASGRTDLERLFQDQGIDVDDQLLERMKSSRQIDKNRRINLWRRNEAIRQAKIQDKDKATLASWIVSGEIKTISPADIQAEISDPDVLMAASRAQKTSKSISKKSYDIGARASVDLTKRLSLMSHSPVVFDRTTTGKAKPADDVNRAIYGEIFQQYLDRIADHRKKGKGDPTDKDEIGFIGDIANQWVQKKASILDRAKSTREYYRSIETKDWEDYSGMTRMRAEAIINATRGRIVTFGQDQTISEAMLESVAAAVERGDTTEAYILSTMSGDDWL